MQSLEAMLILLKMYNVLMNTSIVLELIGMLIPSKILVMPRILK